MNFNKVGDSYVNHPCGCCIPPVTPVVFSTNAEAAGTWRIRKTLSTGLPEDWVFFDDNNKFVKYECVRKEVKFPQQCPSSAPDAAVHFYIDYNFDATVKQEINGRYVLENGINRNGYPVYHKSESGSEFPKGMLLYFCFRYECGVDGWVVARHFGTSRSDFESGRAGLVSIFQKISLFLVNSHAVELDSCSTSRTSNRFEKQFFEEPNFWISCLFWDRHSWRLGPVGGNFYFHSSATMWRF